MERQHPPRDTKVIAVGNQKGGVGKTTNACHISAALGELGRLCLIWDLDVNCGATRHFGIPPETYWGPLSSLQEKMTWIVLSLLTGYDVDVPKRAPDSGRISKDWTGIRPRS